MPGARLTIGLLISELNRGFHRAAFFGIAAAAADAGADLICFDGGLLAAAGSPEAAANVLYDLAGPAVVDGLIIWASALDWNVGAAQTEAFCRRFAPLPVVTVGRAFAGIPSLLVDNYEGMRGALSHLIEHHGQHRIAFLRGPEGALEEELRFQAYRDTLAAHAIPFDARLVSGRTDWQRRDGPVAMQDFLDARGLVAGRDFAAVVSVGDDMACGAMETLQARGVRVPEQVAVIGFNDDDEGRAILPALTTVRQPVEEMGRGAVTALLDRLAGGPAVQTVTLPLELVVRQSCGCLSPSVLQAAARSPAAATVVATEAAGPEQTVRLAEAFAGDLAGRMPGAFLATLNNLLQRDALAGRDLGRWHRVLSALRGRALAGLEAGTLPAAEDLWQQGRVLIGETAAQARLYQRFLAEQDTRRLGEFIRRIQSAGDRETLWAILAETLPDLGAPACYLALYEDHEDPAGMVQLVLACDRGAGSGITADDAIRRRFPAGELLPGRLREGAPRRLVVLPLYFRRSQLGYLLLEVDGRGAAFTETFREQISAALAGLLLREEIRRAWQEAEDANRLKSRFLATVSHELRTPLSLIVGTIEMMRRAPRAPGSVPGESYDRDLESIRASAQHLTHLIGDVLDLASSQAGELRLACEPLQLGEVLAGVSMLGESLAREKGLDWRTSLPARLPLVWGDRTRLQQVALNLVSNAVKFTEHGAITLWAEAGKDDVAVAVSDTGLGIASEEQESIFDEFRRSEQAARRGYGGMGLGLAISRRLIELHRGTIGVLSSGSEGAGSTFYFTLPILADPAAAPCDPPPSQTVVLLCEQAGAGERLAAALTGRGFQVAELVTAGEHDWLARVAAAAPGAVVLDYAPAAERGWELMQAIRQNPATAGVPVLFYHLGEGQDRGALLDLDYLPKPAAASDLVAALARGGFLPGRDAAGRTVLVVDDDPGILDLHVRMVQEHLPGCRVLAAASGREALASMAATPPDLLLLDLMMPDVDGFAVLNAMREHQGTRNTPVIVLTAQILTAEDMARLQAGVAAVLTKGLFSRAELLDQLTTALARSKRLGSEAQRLVRATMAYIHEHYREAIGREELAARACVSDRYLTRCFHQDTGVAPITYLNRYRIHQARALLEAGAANITQVALETGFSDSNYFARLFRREVGVSPSAYLRGERPATLAT